MSDNIKLVIEIPKEDIEFIRKTSFIEDEKTMFKQSPSDRQGTMTLFRLMDSIKNGIPLDDVKAEIEKTKRFHIGTFEDDNPIDYGIVEGFDKAIAILDDIGKAEREE